VVIAGVMMVHTLVAFLRIIPGPAAALVGLKARIYKRCHDLTQRKFNLLSGQAGLDLSPYRFHSGPVLLIWRTENLAPEKPSLGGLSSLKRSS